MVHLRATLCSLLLQAIFSAKALEDSASSDEQNKAIPMLSLANANIEHIQKMFGNLAERLEENADEAMRNFRERRHSDGHKHKKDRKGHGLFGNRMCCNFPTYLTNKQHLKSCHQEFIEKNITRSSSKEENLNTSRCFMECIAKKKGWASEDGAIDKEAVTASMASANATDEWMTLITQAQEKCFSELPTTEGTSTCRPDSQQFMYCIFEHHFLNCPQSSWRESEKCRAAEALIAAVSSRRQGKAEDSSDDD